MRNAFIVFITSAVCYAMYMGGNFAVVASWVMIVGAVNGILVGISYKQKSDRGEEIRRSLRSRGWIYFVCEIAMMYPVYVSIENGWLITAFMYLLSMMFEMSAVVTLKRIVNEKTD